MIVIVAKTLAIMLTMTTCGTWLRGDQRGWVDDGQILPANPILEDDDRKRMKHSVYLFERNRLLDVGEFIGKSLSERLALRLWALTVQTWHVHLLVGHTSHAIADIVKCTKDAVRWGLRPDRPIWSDGYDKRYCFDEASVWNRMRYIERHNLKQDWPAKPWPFLETPSFSPRWIHRGQTAPKRRCVMGFADTPPKCGPLFWRNGSLGIAALSAPGVFTGG